MNKDVKRRTTSRDLGAFSWGNLGATRTKLFWIAGAIGVSVVVAFLLGLRLVVDYQDLNCPPETVVRYRGVGYWTAYCAPSDATAVASTTPTSRYVGVFLVNVNARVFDADMLAGTLHGPALGFGPGR